jgi:hypothetical protein
MQDKSIIYGDYCEAPSRGELQIVQFKALAQNPDQLWENGSLSAFYISNFWETYFHSQNHFARLDIRDSVRYIASELIGNAVKYSATPDIVIKITLNLNTPEFRFFTINEVEIAKAEAYKKFVECLLTCDPEKLYIDQMEKNSADSKWRSSIGFLTIMLDYGGQLAWKFNTNDDTKTLTATTMVRLPVTGNYLSNNGVLVNGSCWQKV